MKTYSTPTIIAQGDVVQMTKNGGPGSMDPDVPITGLAVPVGSLGFGL